MTLLHFLIFFLTEFVRKGSTIQCRYGDDSGLTNRNLTTKICQHSCFSAKLKLNVFYTEKEGNSYKFWSDAKYITTYSCNEFSAHNCTAEAACNYLSDDFKLKTNAKHNFDILSCQGNCCKEDMCSPTQEETNDDATSSSVMLTPSISLSVLLFLCWFIKATW